MPARRPAVRGWHRRRPPSRSACQPSSTARNARSRSATAAAFRLRIPVPISTSPRATRVPLAQPPAASRSAAARSGSVRERLGERRRDHERQVADRGDRPVVVRRRHPDRSRGAGGDQRLHPGDRLLVGRRGRDDHPRPVREQAGVRRARSRSSRARRADARRRTAGPRPGRARRSRPSCSPRPSRRRPGRAGRRHAPACRRARGRRAAARRARRGRRSSTASATPAAARIPSGSAARGPAPLGVQARTSVPGRDRGPRHGAADQPETEHRDAHAPSMSARPPLVSS